MKCVDTYLHRDTIAACQKDESASIQSNSQPVGPEASETTYFIPSPRDRDNGKSHHQVILIATLMTDNICRAAICCAGSSAGRSDRASLKQQTRFRSEVEAAAIDGIRKPNNDNVSIDPKCRQLGTCSGVREPRTKVIYRLEAS